MLNWRSRASATARRTASSVPRATGVSGSIAASAPPPSRKSIGPGAAGVAVAASCVNAGVAVAASRRPPGVEGVAGAASRRPPVAVEGVAGAAASNGRAARADVGVVTASVVSPSPPGRNLRSTAEKASTSSPSLSLLIWVISGTAAFVLCLSSLCAAPAQCDADTSIAAVRGRGAS